MHVGDVDVAFGGRAADIADNARLVVVRDVEHVLAQLGFQRNAAHVDHARLVLDECATNAARLRLGFDGYRDPAGVLVATLVVRLDHVDVAVARHFARISLAGLVANVPAAPLAVRLEGLHRVDPHPPDRRRRGRRSPRR